MKGKIVLPEDSVKYFEMLLGFIHKVSTPPRVYGSHHRQGD